MESESESEESESEESESESETATEEGESEGSESGSGSQSLAIEQRHPNGSVLRVTSLEVEATSITVGIEVVNGLGQPLGLAAGGATVRLTDNLGFVYEFIDPLENPDLRIEARGTLSGELVYFGILNPEATTLRLQTNIGLYEPASRVQDPSAEATNTSSPRFSVEIPLAP